MKDIKKARAIYYSARKKHINNIKNYLVINSLQKDFDEFKKNKKYSYSKNYYRYFFISINKLKDYYLLEK